MSLVLAIIVDIHAVLKCMHYMYAVNIRGCWPDCLLLGVVRPSDVKILINLKVCVKLLEFALRSGLLLSLAVSCFMVVFKCDVKSK